MGFDYDLDDAVGKLCTPSAPTRTLVESGMQCTLPIENPMYRAILDEFIDDLPKRVAAMRAALESGDFDNLAELAHGLKGSAGSIGYTAFTDPCRQLEQSARQRQLDDINPLVEQVAAISDGIEVPINV